MKIFLSSPPPQNHTEAAIIKLAEQDITNAGHALVPIADADMVVINTVGSMGNPPTAILAAAAAIRAGKPIIFGLDSLFEYCKNRSGESF